MLAGDIEHWQERSFGPWIFFEIATGMFVGRAGLRSTTIAGSECVEVAYAVRPDAWGHGYATDMAAVAVEHARHLGLVEVVGTLPEHRRRGLAHALTAEALRRLRGHGARSASLYVDGLNPTRAYDVYARLGFTVGFQYEVFEAQLV